MFCGWKWNDYVFYYVIDVFYGVNIFLVVI